MDPTRLAVLGAGNIGTVHLESARAMDGVDVRAVADQVPVNRERARSRCGCHTYDDYADLLAEESVDVAVVALPPHLHARVAAEAAAEGCHVFVEKPLARSGEEAREIVDACDRAGVRLGVDHTLRYMPAIQALKERFDAGEFGHVPTVSTTRFNDGPFGSPPDGGTPASWQLDPDATGGGALMDLGVHLFDVLRWFFGDLAVEHATFDRQLDLPYEDTATVVLGSEGGTTATVTCGFFQREDPDDVNFSFQLDGVAGTGRRGDHAPDSLVRHAAGSAVANTLRRVTGRSIRPFAPTYFYRAHFEALRAFFRAVDADEEPPVSGHDGVRAVELVEQAYRAGGSAAPDRSAASDRRGTAVSDDGSHNASGDGVADDSVSDDVVEAERQGVEP